MVGTRTQGSPAGGRGRGGRGGGGGDAGGSGGAGGDADNDNNPNVPAEALRAEVEASLIANPDVIFDIPPLLTTEGFDTARAATEFAIRFIRYVNAPTGPLRSAVTYLSGAAAPPDGSVQHNVSIIRARLLGTDVYTVIDACEALVATSLIAELRSAGERINYTLNRLAAVDTPLIDHGGQANQGDTSRGANRPTDASRALKPGAGDHYHGPTAVPHVDVFEWLCALDAVFDAADANADIKLTDATKRAHTISLLRGSVLIDFKAAYQLSSTSRPTLQRWALHDDTVYDFTSFFIDVHTTLDERERAYADYGVAKAKGYYTDPGSIARTLVRKRNRVGSGATTPSHLRIAPNTLLNDYLRMLSTTSSSIQTLSRSTRVHALSTVHRA